MNAPTTCAPAREMTCVFLTEIEMEQVEGIRRAAQKLLDDIEYFNAPTTPEFMATLRQLAVDPVRPGVTVASPRMRHQFDRDIEAMAIAAMTDHQVEQSWYRWRLAPEAAC